MLDDGSTMTDIAYDELAREARIRALTMIYEAGSGHPGGSLSCMDLLTILYHQQLRRDGSPELRDRLVLSKGHACPALYAVGSQTGDIPLSECSGFRKIGRKLQGHPHVLDTPYVETSTGSLGQGFSTALGMALGNRHQGIGAHTFAILGDGEVQEGMVWEAAMFAAHYKLSQLCAILDYNKMQSDDTNANIMGLEPLADKWRAFGWNVTEIDGHVFPEIESALKRFVAEQLKPTIIIAHTIKGKGVSYMEGVPSWHGSVKLSDANLREALSDLKADDATIEACLNGSYWEVAL